jgi:ATP-binding cassette, subfamily C, bacterial CydC
VITHQPIGLDRMDEIFVLDRGEIQARGSHDQLLDTSERYRRMWALAASSE